MSCVFVVLQVSVEVGELRQTLQAYHRILDLQNKFTDMEVTRMNCNSLYCVLCGIMSGAAWSRF